MKGNVVKTSLGVTLILCLGYAVSFLKESVIANYFGAGASVDAYTIALQIPVVLFSFVAVAIRSVVLPLYTDVRLNSGDSESREYISVLISILSAASLVFIILIFWLSPYVIKLFAPGFTEETNSEAALLLRILCPTILTTIISNICTSVLNVHGKFVLPSLAVLALNTTLIVAVLILHSWMGIASAAVGQVIGCFVEIVFLYMLMRKHVSVYFKFDIHNKHMITSMKMSLPVIWSTSLAEITAMINRIVASFLFVGSIAVLNYATKINSVFMSLFTSAIATIIYPMYAESAARQDMSGLCNRVNKTLSTYVMFLLPLTCIIIGLKKEIIEAAFARGAFGMEAVDRTQVLLGWLSVGLIFMGFRESLTKVFYSLKDTKTPAKNASIGFCVNIVCACSLPFFMGVQGLAITTALTAIVISMGLVRQLMKKHKSIRLSELVSNIFRLLPCSLVAMLIMYILRNYIQGLNVFAILVICGIAYVIVYVIMLTAFKVQIWHTFVKALKGNKHNG